MRKKSALICFVVFAITLTPWGLFDYCARHAESHQHHGTCGEGMMDQSHGLDQSVPELSAIPCQALAMATDDFTTKIPGKKLTSSQVVIITILYKLVVWELPETEVLIVSEPDSTSDPPLGNNALRGPPLV